MKSKIIALLSGLLLFGGCVNENAPEELGLCNGKLKIYKSAKSSNGITVLILPGGGYSFYDLNAVNSWIPLFSERGYSIALFYYDMPDGNPEKTIQSVIDAIRELRANADGLEIDPNSIGIMGISAGAHLAAMTSSRLSVQERPIFQILSSPLLSMESDITDNYSVKNLLGELADDQNRKRYSPIYLVDENTPSTFLLYALDDNVVSPQNSIKYSKALLEHNVKVGSFSVLSGTHAAESSWNEWDDVFKSVFEWLLRR